MIPQFATKAERLTWLRENKGLWLRAKKSAIKHADAVKGGLNLPVVGKYANVAESVAKEIGAATPAANGLLYVKSVINTTNLFDSHGDVHIPGIWKKSLNDNSEFLFLQEHKMQFANVIADDSIAYTKSISWKSLGFDYSGNTQALVFDNTVRAARNEYMYDQYSKGHVKQHSVGMYYVNISLCVNSEEKWYREEKDNWEKYFSEIVNQGDADEAGIFWAVTEGKIAEGSAVVRGSNFATPTLEISEAAKGTSGSIEPDTSTQPRKGLFASVGSKINNN